MSTKKGPMCMMKLENLKEYCTGGRNGWLSIFNNTKSFVVISLKFKRYLQFGFIWITTIQQALHNAIILNFFLFI